MNKCSVRDKGSRTPIREGTLCDALVDAILDADADQRTEFIYKKESKEKYPFL